MILIAVLLTSQRQARGYLLLSDRLKTIIVMNRAQSNEGMT